MLSSVNALIHIKISIPELLLSDYLISNCAYLVKLTETCTITRIFTNAA